MARLGEHAVVIGGSIAGLLTLRVLSDFFDRVTVLERDQIEDRPVIHKSIPQGNHFHGLLQGGQQALSSLYPGFTDALCKLLSAHTAPIGFAGRAFAQPRARADAKLIHPRGEPRLD